MNLLHCNIQHNIHQLDVWLHSHQKPAQYLHYNPQLMDWAKWLVFNHWFSDTTLDCSTRLFEESFLWWTLSTSFDLAGKKNALLCLRVWLQFRSLFKGIKIHSECQHHVACREVTCSVTYHKIYISWRDLKLFVCTYQKIVIYMSCWKPEDSWANELRGNDYHMLRYFITYFNKML